MNRRWCVQSARAAHLNSSDERPERTDYFAGIGATMFSVAPALASWMEESEAGSYQKAKHDCDSWAFNQVFLGMQDKSYQDLAGDLIKINSGTTYNVPTAFCYHDPESRTLLGYRYRADYPSANRSKEMTDSDLPTWIMGKHFKFKNI